MQYLLAFLALIVLIIVHEAGHFWAARLCRMKVERFSIFFGPAIARFRRGGTEFQIGTIPLGGFVQITGMNPMEDHDRADPFIYPNRPAWQRFLAIVAGPWANYIAAVLIMFPSFLVWGVPRPSSQQEVVRIVPGLPAARAGMEAGDLIVSVDGNTVTTDRPASEYIERGAGKAVHLVVAREGKSKEITVAPEKASDGHFRIGVQLDAHPEYRREGVLSAAKNSILFPVEYSYQSAMSLVSLVRGKYKVDDLTGVVGITHQFGKQIKRGLRPSLEIVAMLSIFLGFFNLLPIPALDGGRLAFLCYEIVSRRRVNQRVEAGIHMVGFVVLLGVMVLVTLQDIRRLLRM